MVLPGQGWNLERMASPGIDDLPVVRFARYLHQDVGGLLRRYGRWLDADLVGQIQGAANSLVLNVGEAASLNSPGKKAYHYEVAKGSAGELLRALDVASDRIPHSAAVNRPRRRARQIMGQLARLIRHFRRKR